MYAGLDECNGFFLQTLVLGGVNGCSSLELDIGEILARETRLNKYICVNKKRQ